MKATFIFRNVGDADKAGIIFQVSYLVKTGDVTKIEIKEYNLSIMPNQETAQEIDFGTALADQEILVLVRDSAGKIIAQKNFILKSIDGQKQQIEFVINKPDTDSTTALQERKPVFVYGRLVDKKGIHNMEDIQIIISVKRGDIENLIPLTSVRTEAQGYFFIDYPDEYFTEAVALIGLELVENPISIKLEKKTIKEKDVNGQEVDKEVSFFSHRIILIAELKDNIITKEATTDCGCHANEFQEKKALEEFSFYSLVRTSQPEIKGYILKEEDEITLDEVLKDLIFISPELIEALKNLTINIKVSPVRAVKSQLVPNINTTINRARRTANTEDDYVEPLKHIKIKKEVLRNFLKEEKTLSKDNVSKLFAQNESAIIERALNPAAQRTQSLSSRVELDAIHSIDWDDEPTIYQAVEIAHGHLLQYKSEWIADGYSLGDLLYSLPLAPGQKKQIVVYDWERRESASNMQTIDFEENLYNSLSRDRDILEITKGIVQENVSGGSSASTKAIGGGIGGFAGVLFGVAGGASKANSTAWQNSLRQTSASDQQKLRDRITQSASAVRSMRSTVIQTVSQGERFEVSSESVANYNHCHAITIQYYEVLRHFKIRQRFADAREVLFVPLLMSQFDLKKALRWRETLQAALIDRRLTSGFDSGDRVLHEWKDTGFPSGTFASENIITASGSLRIQFVIQRPRDKYDGGKAILDSAAWSFYNNLFGANFAEEFYRNYLENQERKDDIFHSELGEKIARKFIANLTFVVLDETNKPIGTIPIDAALTSRYYKDGILNVRLNWNDAPFFAREKIHYLKISSSIFSNLPTGSFLTVHSGYMRYKTKHFKGNLFQYQYLGDDLTNTDGVIIYAGPTMEELKDPRKEDLVVVNKLIAHLNDNLEYYHKALWMNMTPERRFMLLDGIILNGKGEGKSVASLVQNDLLTIVGNSLVLPVARGLNLDPEFGLNESLTEFYMTAAAEPISVSVPTKGVFAEAVMGKCNSCEKIDESRFWRWEESPIPDSPTAITPINTDSRRAEPGNLQPQQLPSAIVNIQNAPNAPDPTGLAGTLGLLGQNNLFKDITGLEGNQRNAMQALQSSLDTAKAFAQEAGKLEVQGMQEASKIAIQKEMGRKLDKALSTIENDPNLSGEQKKELKEKAFNAYLGAGATTQEIAKNPKVEEFKQRVKSIDDMVKDKIISPEQGKEIKEKEIKRFTENTESKPIASLEGIERTSDTAAKNNTSIELDSMGNVKVTPMNTKIAGDKFVLPPDIQYRYSSAIHLLNEEPDDIAANEIMNIGEILLFNFPVNGSSLIPSHITLLEEVAAFFGLENRAKLIIEGHASQTGPESNNLILSEVRAKTVFDYLTEDAATLRVNPNQIIETIGVGSYEPIIDKMGNEEKLNRSVLIKFAFPQIISSIPEPKPDGSKDWRIKIELSIGAGIGTGIGIGGKLIKVQISSRDEDYDAGGNFVLAGVGAEFIGAGFEFSADLGNSVNFSTKDMIKIEDFNHASFRLSSSGGGAFLEYNKTSLAFPSLGVNRINVGGWSLGVSANFTFKNKIWGFLQNIDI
ncbi:OmpA family protein [Runella aurantiaca]|uniref:OmpA family protein n=1 Tax=Runella aurantiaca TaxID=2282308 RepID=A0A369HXT4_9BACT|nr:OmpA family protein [Runella aurantiaca]RDB02341.1 OmpA family protein [Runella aurantiaca]